MNPFLTHTNPVFWLWVPLAVLAFQVILENTLDERTLKNLLAESGPHELLQFLVIAAAAVIGWRTLKEMNRGASPWLTFWIALAALCCTYVAIEEISWGQSFLKWGTPEFWAQVNKQQETNFHNTSSWLDQKPRMILQAGIFVGGLVIPFLRRFKPQWLPARFAIIYPPSILAVTAGTLAVFRIVNLIGHHILHYDLFTRPNEIAEVFMFWFVLLYLLHMRQALKTGSRAVTG